MTENDCEDQGFSRISDGCTQCRSGGRRIALGRRLTAAGSWGWQCPQCKGWYGDAPPPKETGLLFQAPMVRALLRDVDPKTQTRRVVKLNASGRVSRGGRNWHCEDPEAVLACPYGQPGDRLWVREKWAPDPPIDDSWASTEWSGCGRRIDGVPERFHHPRFCNYAADWLHGPIRWRPGIHMPRWASRILLELTEVRVQRLQDISEADAMAEGIDPDGDEWRDCCLTPRTPFLTLWESINGLGSWDANPWVWALSFRRINE